MLPLKLSPKDILFRFWYMHDNYARPSVVDNSLIPILENTVNTVLKNDMQILISYTTCYIQQIASKNQVPCLLFQWTNRQHANHACKLLHFFMTDLSDITIHHQGSVTQINHTNHTIWTEVSSQQLCLLMEILGKALNLRIP